MKSNEIPLLLIAYSKIDSVKKIFKVLSEVKPKSFYFYVNKPDDKNIEIINNGIRRLILQVDWECEIETFFREEPVGIYDSLNSAIDWFYSQVDMGIILEEDTVPNISFFEYVSHYVENSAGNSSNLVISGNNYFDRKVDSDWQSCELQIYGWFSTREIWIQSRKFLVTKQRIFSMILSYSPIISFFFVVLFLRGKRTGSRFKAWDLQLQFFLLLNKIKVIRPRVNLVTNEGVNGYHQKSERYYHNVPSLLWYDNGIIGPNIHLDNLSILKRMMDIIR